MSGDEGATLGEDGLFKLLTWRSRAITKIFNLPDIAGEPLQQEFQHPIERRVDRLYRLADGSLLNIEHQSSLHDRESLARRMIAYRNMIRERFSRPMIIRQVVAFTGSEPKDRRRIGGILTYDDIDQEGNGVRFSTVLRDFLSVPVEVFRESGEIDDLILGILASGGGDTDYIEEVARRIISLRGEDGRDAKAKFVAVCVIRGDERAVRGAKELDVWMNEVKDNPIAKRFVEIAGKERIEEQSRRTLAKLLVAHASKLKLEAPTDAESLLAAHATEASLFEMANDMENMSDFDEFIKSHGVDLAGRAS